MNVAMMVLLGRKNVGMRRLTASRSLRRRAAAVFILEVFRHRNAQSRASEVNHTCDDDGPNFHPEEPIDAVCFSSRDRQKVARPSRSWAWAWSVEGIGSARSASQEKSAQLRLHNRDDRATIFHES
jgi:hypothetical protein